MVVVPDRRDKAGSNAFVKAGKIIHALHPEIAFRRGAAATAGNEGPFAVVYKDGTEVGIADSPMDLFVLAEASLKRTRAASILVQQAAQVEHDLEEDIENENAPNNHRSTQTTKTSKVVKVAGLVLFLLKATLMIMQTMAFMNAPFKGALIYLVTRFFSAVAPAWVPVSLIKGLMAYYGGKTLNPYAGWTTAFTTARLRASLRNAPTALVKLGPKDNDYWNTMLHYFHALLRAEFPKATAFVDLASVPNAQFVALLTKIFRMKKTVSTLKAQGALTATLIVQLAKFKEELKTATGDTRDLLLKNIRAAMDALKHLARAGKAAVGKKNTKP